MIYDSAAAPGHSFLKHSNITRVLLG